MRLLFAIGFVLVFHPFRTSCLRCVKTRDNKTCVYPFTINNVTYNECTKAHDKFEQLWCSTKTDTDGNHVEGQNEWGHCDSNCEVLEETPLRCELTDLNGPRKREKCVFPFIFDKVEYNGCAVDRQDRRRRWCSTKIDRDGVHIDGEEGFCDQDCRYHKPGLIYQQSQMYA